MKKAFTNIFILLTALLLLSCQKTNAAENQKSEKEQDKNVQSRVLAKNVYDVDFEKRVNQLFSLGNFETIEMYNKTFLYIPEAETNFKDISKIKEYRVYEYSFSQEKYFIDRRNVYNNGLLIIEDESLDYDPGDVTFIYDEKGRLIKTGNMTCEYPETNIPNKYHRLTYIDGTLKASEYLEKTENGHKYIMVQTSDDFSNLYPIEQIFEYNNKKITRLICKYNGRTSRQYDYFYDENSRLSQMKESAWAPDGFTSVSNWYYTYPDSNTMEVNGFDSDRSGAGAKIRKVFTDYDKQGNWLKETEYRDYRIYNKYYREITYIDEK